MPFLAGEVIDGRYQIIEEIGAGGHGTVFRGKDVDLDSDVAIKVLHPEFAQDADFAKRMEREARAMGQLAGTSAVQVMAFNRTSAGGMYLVMEYLDGWDLGRYLYQYEKQSKHLPIDEMIELLDPIATTLEAAHVRKIIHRDLKLANIFVLKNRARGRVRLLDFGLVKDMKMPAMTMPGTVAGSPAYIAPEGWRGRPDLVDHRIDVYSFGVVVYRVLGGRFPFNPDQNLADIIIEATTKPRPSLLGLRPDLPAGIDDWVQKALAIKPAERFQSVQSLWYVLRGLLTP